MNLELRQRLERVARRIRSLRLWNGLAICWIFWALVGLALFAAAVGWGWQVPREWPVWLAALAGLTGAIAAAAIHRSTRDHRLVARRIEARHPELATLLLAAIEQRPQSGQPLGYLQSAVVRDAVDHGRKSDWTDAVSTARMRLAQCSHFAALGVLALVCASLAGRAGANVRHDLGSLSPRGKGASTPAFDVKIEPGNTEIERNTALLVVAEFGKSVPADATLFVSNADEETSIREMVRTLDDPKFVGRVPSVANDLSYYVEFDGRRTETYRVTVFDFPDLVRADAELVYPSFTLLEPVTVPDVRHVTAVEGTDLTLVFTLNKPVRKAHLAGSDGRDIDLVRDGGNETIYRTNWKITESRRFKLRLVDDANRENRFPADIVVNVTPNRPPKIAIERPGRDVDVSPLEELQIKGNATDDFGVVGRGLSYSIGGGEPREAPLPTDVAPAKRHEIEQLIDFEALGAEPDQLVSYYVWAEDIGPDGKLRRVFSDMYFAEVRPFEEIYRQGQQPSQAEMEREQRERQQQGQEGQGGASQEAGELAELQKEIINATWKLIRRETASTPTAEFGEDSRAIQESQRSLLEQLSGLAERLQDAESAQHLENARKYMNEALERQTEAADRLTPQTLRGALPAEQAAYQSLLKLRARQFEVVRGQQGQRGQRGGRGQRGQRSQRGQRNSLSNRNTRQQRQLSELELSPDENRYEMQTRADSPTPEETLAQREQREVLSRLQQLAQRQGDVNERMRELQSELESAETPQQREQIERELQRLRDQQRELLRDADELIGQMDRADSQQQMHNAREQMNESRDRMQQATEALGQGRLPDALTEGTRAGRELNDVRDQFRRETADRFSEEMNEMRRSARNLDEEQRRLSERLTQQDEETARSLRDTGERAETLDGLNRQREELGDLLQRMQQTVEEAEQPEPLLARQLYETLREADQRRIDDALDVTQRLLEVGIEREASESMRSANEGISELRQGIERAAESVLGDESEALRQAQREIDRLAEELNREIQNALGEQGATRDDVERQRDGQNPGQGADGTNQDRNREPSQDPGGAPGERQNYSGSEDSRPSRGGDGTRSDQTDEGRQSGGEAAEQEDRQESREGVGQQRRGGIRGARPGDADESSEQRGRGLGRQGEPNRDGGQQGRGARRGQRSESSDDQQPGSGGQDNTRNESDAANPRSPGRGVPPNDAPTEEQAGEGRRQGENQRPAAGGRGDERQPGRRGGIIRGGGGGFDWSQVFNEDTWRGPITGDDFRNWSDRLRDVEETLSDDQLRSDTARIRDRAGEFRRSYRQGATPDWNKLRDLVAEPLVELSRRIGEEIQRRDLPDALVPIDRDPVPPGYAEQVRQYYERLGSGE
jgi:hypothetical protein